MIFSSENTQNPKAKLGKTALLIDAENISHYYANEIMNQALSYGQMTIRRIYADWSRINVLRWRDGIRNYAIMPVQQFDSNSGKNSSDMALVVDAMELVLLHGVNTLVLATSDSDFTPLVLKVREFGVHVIGIGMPNASKSLANACTNFHYLTPYQSSKHPYCKNNASEYNNRYFHDNKQYDPDRTSEQDGFIGYFGTNNPSSHIQLGQTLGGDTEKNPPNLPKDPNKDNRLLSIIQDVINLKGNQGRIQAAQLGAELSHAGISPGYYGCKKLAEVIKRLHGFEVVMVNNVSYVQKTSPSHQAKPWTGHQLQSGPDLSGDTLLINTISQAIAVCQDRFGWTSVSRLASYLREQNGISANQYGYPNMSALLPGLDMFKLGWFEGVHFVCDKRQVTDDSVVPEFLNYQQKNHQAKADTPSNQERDKLLADDKLMQALKDIMLNCQDEKGWVLSSVIGTQLRQRGISAKDYGYKNTGMILKTLGIYETKMVGTTAYLKDPSLPTLPKEKASDANKADDAPVDLDVVTQPKQVQNFTAVQDLQAVLPFDSLDTVTDDQHDDQNEDQADSLIQQETLAQDQPSEDEDAWMDGLVQSLSGTDSQIEDVQTEDDYVVGSDVTLDDLDQDIPELADDSVDEDDGGFHLSDLLALIDESIAHYANELGYAKVGDIGKYVRQAIGMGSQSFGFANFGELLLKVGGYEVVRQGRAMVVKPIETQD